MQPSVQQILFQGVDTHLSSYMDNWRHLSTQFYTPTAHNIQESIVFLLQAYGLKTQYLDQHQKVIYAELVSGSSYTLLLHINYTAKSLTSGNLQSILPLVASLAAVHTYQNTLGPLPLNIKWLLVEQNTNQQTDLRRIVTNCHLLLQADNCLMYTTKREISKDGHIPELILGTKGLLCVELCTKTTEKTIASHYGAIAPNPAWQLIWALNSLKDSREDILIEGFYDNLVPPDDKVLASLATIPDTAQAQAQKWGLNQLLLGLHGTQQHYAYYLTPTCTVNSIQSKPIHTSADALHTETTGMDQSQIPTGATAQLSFYLVPAQDPHDIFTKLQSHLDLTCGPGIKASLLAARHPAVTSLQEPIVRHLQQSITTIYQHTPTIIPLTAELATFELFHTQLSIPTIGITLPATTQTPPIAHPSSTHAMDTDQSIQLLTQQIQQHALLFSFITEKMLYR
jgi:acetylornithine deacetylase/succinyl-diaminopimelate desuccinylase-like protein